MPGKKILLMLIIIIIIIGGCIIIIIGPGGPRPGPDPEPWHRYLIGGLFILTGVKGLIEQFMDAGPINRDIDVGGR